MGYLLFCGYYFFRPFRAPPAVLCESGYLLERFLRAKGELRKRKDRCGGGTMHMSPYVAIFLFSGSFPSGIPVSVITPFFITHQVG